MRSVSTANRSGYSRCKVDSQGRTLRNLHSQTKDPRVNEPRVMFATEERIMIPHTQLTDQSQFSDPEKTELS